MQEEKSAYRQIMKGTSLFGGVQVFNILIAIVRSKIIAVLLGPSGMGIAALLNSTIKLISVLTNFGLGTSAVKDIAAVNETGDTTRIAKIITVFRRLVWITGFLGGIVTILLSNWLSRITFGNEDYSLAFVWLSCVLLFNQLTRGQNVLLQGLRKLQYLAKANIIGSALGLIISFPIYYFWKIDGIVPAIILSSVITLGITWMFSKRIKLDRINVTWHEIILEGKGMLQMGFMLSLGGLMTAGGSFLVRIYISGRGGIEEVGLYNAGFAIVTTYAGLVLAAMATDYYPRLSGVAHDNNKASLLINQQAEIGVLILAPILTVFFIFINWVVILLYSTKFTPINGMIQWAALGMYFKVASWSISFILLAKGAAKMFFWNELIANSYMLGLNILGYYLYGLDGLGISFLISYLLYLLQVFFLAKYKFEFIFNNGFYKIFIVQIILGIACFSIKMFIDNWWSYILGIIIILISTWYSFQELDRRIGIRLLLKSWKT